MFFSDLNHLSWFLIWQRGIRIKDSSLTYKYKSEFYEVE